MTTPLMSMTGLAFIVLLFSTPLAGQEVEQVPLKGGKFLEVMIFRPTASDLTPTTALPLMLALSPGGQDARMARVAADMIAKPAVKRGYIVAVPIKRNKLFYQGGEKDLPALFDWLEEQQTIDRSRSIVMGISNGGRSAMKVMSLWPDRFGGVATSPGLMAREDKTKGLKGKAVWMRVGKSDSKGWRTGSKSTAERLEKAGCLVSHEVVPGGHVIPVKTDEALDFLESKILGFRRVEIKSTDGVVVIGELYETGDKKKPTILFCHQANSSRGEYRTVASRLKAAGYNGLAIDQRSGQGNSATSNFIKNETAAAFKKAGGKADYLAAQPDIEAAYDWLNKEGFSGKRALWGSSYSASLAIVIGSERKDLDAILCFSPGEYLGSPDLVSKAAAAVSSPILIVAPESERKSAGPIFESLPADLDKKFLINSDILHGTRTLFATPPEEQKALWKEVESFLKKSLGS
ncbi:alpha/beta hydrolase [Mariniblastus sp.]|nr:alpha/beta hydrolase [Mariniblastus sp.]